MTQVLLHTKLTPPRLHPSLVARVRLLAQLDTTDHYTMTLISAPAGSGKTTLVASWLETLKASNTYGTAWLSLDAGDNDPVRFLTYLIGALKQAMPDLADTASVIVHAAQPPSEAVMASLLNEIGFSPHPVILVVDDYHLIHDPLVHAFMVFLIEHGPPPLHLVLISRSDPPFPLMRYRARRQMHEVRAADLRFTLAEVSAFVDTILSTPLSRGDIAELEARTEGWIAGIQLAALSLQSHPDPHALLLSFTGNNRHIFSYLVEEVLEHQPPNIRAFLLQTSLLERLTGSLCDYVTEQSNSDAVLHQLVRSNLFVVPLDDEQRWYRYHQLFADVLAAQLRQSTPALIPALHERASLWFEQNGDYDDAVRHAFAAGQPERVVQLLETYHARWFVGSEYATLQTYLDAFPSDLLETRPRLCLKQTWLSLASGQIERAATYIGLVEAHFATHPLPEELAIELDATRACYLNLTIPSPAAIEFGDEVLARIPPQQVNWRSALTNILALSHYHHGHMEVASRLALDAIAISQRMDRVGLIVAAVSVLADIRLEQGNLEEAEQLLQQALEWGQPLGRALPLSRMVLVFIGVSRVNYERHDFDRAAHYLEQARELSQRIQHTEGTYYTHMAMSRLRVAQQDIPAALMHVDAALPYAAKDDVLQQLHLEAVRMALRLAQGQGSAVNQWVMDTALPALRGADETRSLLLRETVALLLTTILLKLGNPHAALPLIEAFLPAAQQDGRGLGAIRWWVLQAWCQQELRAPDNAFAALQTALVWGQAGGFITIFLDYEHILAPLLARCLATDPQNTYILGLLDSVGYQSAVLPAISPAQPTLVDTLTPREQEVLRQVALGLTDAAIAAHLTISVRTVSTHLHRIYSKLDVTSRTAAARWATEQGMV